LTSEIQRRTLAVQMILDTLHNTPERDTIGVGRVRQVAFECGARFFTADTTPQGQFALLDLMLAAQQDSLAHTAVLRRLAAANTSGAKDTVIRQALTTYLAARPVRVSAAMALVTLLDTLGHAHLLTRIWAHNRLAELWIDAKDRRHGVQEYERVVALGPLATPTQWDTIVAGEKDGSSNVSSIREAYVSLIWNYFSSFDTAASAALMQRYRREFLSRFPSKWSKDVKYYGLRFHPEDTLRTDSALKFYGAALSGRHSTWTQGAKSYPRWRADYWCSAQQRSCTAHNDTLQPVLGQITVLVGVDPWAAYFKQSPLEGNEFAPVSAYLRRLVTAFQDRGVVFTIVVPSAGATSMEGAVTPAQEAERARWFFQEHEHLPVNVVLQVHHDQWRPAPDGRRIIVDTVPIERGSTGFDDGIVTQVDPNGMMFLVKRDGRVLLSAVGGLCQAVTPRGNCILHPTEEGQIMDGLQRALSLSATDSATDGATDGVAKAAVPGPSDGTTTPVVEHQ
jgi:hypothetical protein